jgi:ligand-binding SRPBCC domain-containing protein
MAEWGHFAEIGGLVKRAHPSRVLAMPIPIELDFVTRVGAPGAEVWAVASTMDGVNAELGPLVRMTVPKGAAGRIGDGVSFRSWLLALGILPLDRHSLVVERVIDGGGFDEESTSWLQQRWRHERRITDHGDGTSTVADHLVVVPRIAISRSLVATMVGQVFRHRHRRLVRRFGTPEDRPTRS